MERNNTWQQTEMEALSNHPCPAGKMLQLRNQFFDVVRSNRTLDQIENIRGLIKVLEKRDELNDTHLAEIAMIVNFNSACSIPSNNLPNDTAGGNLEPPRRETLIPSANPSNRSAELTIVYKQIVDRLGEQWYDFARHLDVPEHEIDGHHKRGDERKTIMLILEHHEKHCDPHVWRQKLLTALEKARRKDLGRRVAEHLDRFNIINFQTCYS